MQVGYARVSTEDQDTALQLDALRRAGVRIVYSEKGSSVGPRPELQRALARLRPGDVLVVWKIDRMARSLVDLLHLLAKLKQIGAQVRSLTEPIDTSSAMGEFVLQILGAVAQLERSMIRDRCVAGQIAARARGQTWGRARAFTPEEAATVVTMWREGWGYQRTLAEMFGVSIQCMRDTIWRAESRGKWATDR